MWVLAEHSHGMKFALAPSQVRLRALAASLSSFLLELRYHPRAIVGPDTLALHQRVDQNRASVGESESIVMLASHLRCDLGELRNIEVDGTGFEPTTPISHVRFEGQLGTRQEADGDVFFCGRGKT